MRLQQVDVVRTWYEGCWVASRVYLCLDEETGIPVCHSSGLKNGLWFWAQFSESLTELVLVNAIFPVLVVVIAYLVDEIAYG